MAWEFDKHRTIIEALREMTKTIEKLNDTLDSRLRSIRVDNDQHTRDIVEAIESLTEI